VQNVLDSRPHARAAASLTTHTVSRLAEIAPGVFSLSVPRTASFLPGQCVALTISPETPARYYSIASGAGESELSVLFDHVPGGALTPKLCRLRPGDTVLVSAPFGEFTDRAGEPAVWIATGTGIAPFLSMARSFSTHGKTLIHGARSADRFYFAAELSRLLGPRYIRCASRGRDHGAEIYAGRLTAYLREAAECAPEERYYLCGSAGMVVDVRDILIDRGVAYRNIVSEIYF